jgi:molybdate transport system substrate-binding protein
MKFNKLLKFVSSLALSIVMMLSLATPAFAASAGTDSTTTLNLMAAASMHYSLGDQGVDGTYPSGTLLKAFEDQNPNITVNVTYDSSGNLLNQMIANPTSSDVFISADLAHMNSAVSAGIIDSNTVYNLLNNQLVLVGNKSTGPTSLTYAGVLAWLQAGTSRTIAIGDPTVVPAGTYTEQVFNTIDPTGATWNSIITNYAHQYSNVSAVLDAVASGVDPIGSVYATDAKQSPTLNVLDTQDVSIIYPIGITNAAMNDGVRAPAAQALVDFLKADIVKPASPPIDGGSIFQYFGFSAAQ